MNYTIYRVNAYDDNNTVTQTMDFGNYDDADDFRHYLEDLDEYSEVMLEEISEEE